MQGREKISRSARNDNKEAVIPNALETVSLPGMTAIPLERIWREGYPIQSRKQLWNDMARHDG